MSLLETHHIVCHASQDAVYQIISASHKWPQIFEPCIAVEVLQRDAGSELIRVTARVNGTPAMWESKREFLPDVYGINSQVLKPMPLVQSMRTTWRVLALNAGQSMLVLEHEFEIVDAVAGIVPGVETREQAIAYMRAAIDSNSSTELGNIRAAAEGANWYAPARTSRNLSHTIVCNAPADVVYACVADASNWPRIFEPCVSASVLESGEDGELVKIEAWQSGKLISWNTRRRYHPQIRRIDFYLPQPMPFLKTMSGQWRVLPLGEKQCLLNVIRHVTMLDADQIAGIRDDVTTLEQACALVNRFIDNNASAEMSAIKTFVETGVASFTSFQTEYFLPHAAQDVYAVLANARDWHQVLPHCEAVNMLYDDGENQEFVMRIQTPHGVENFRSIRRCDPDQLQIRYFQPQPPAILARHNGSWAIKSVPGGCEIISFHAIEVIPSRCAEMFGEDDLSGNKRRVKELICNNSAATIKACGVRLLALAEPALSGAQT